MAAVAAAEGQATEELAEADTHVSQAAVGLGG